ncbi:MAG: OmpA family protein [Flavobacterium sp.]
MANFKLIILFLFGIIKITYSQELIANGDFEDNYSRPLTYGQGSLVKFWKGVANGRWSPVTYFYESEAKTYVPTSKIGGKQSPYSGHGFIGLGIAFKDAKKVGSQYFETILSQPLKKDSTYIITAFVSLADKLKYALDYIPVALSDRSMLTKDGTPVFTTNVIKLKADAPYLNDITNWMKISTTYKARGGELFFIIGGIEGNNKIDPGLKTQRMPFNASFHYLVLNKLTYYFIDNIFIRPQFITNNAITPSFSADSINKIIIQKEQKIILDDLTFETNSYKLKDSANASLKKLVSILSECKLCSVEIIGYTDNSGTDNYNNKLSVMRAKTIYEYLHSKEVLNKNAEYKGLGKNNPLNGNSTKEERAMNRRVEVIIRGSN